MEIAFQTCKWDCLRFSSRIRSKDVNLIILCWIISHNEQPDKSSIENVTLSEMNRHCFIIQQECVKRHAASSTFRRIAYPLVKWRYWIDWNFVKDWESQIDQRIKARLFIDNVMGSELGRWAVDVDDWWIKEVSGKWRAGRGLWKETDTHMA